MLYYNKDLTYMECPRKYFFDTNHYTYKETEESKPKEKLRKMEQMREEKGKR